MKKSILITSIILVAFSIVIGMNSETDNEHPQIAFVSDTQEPMWIEGVFLGKDNNVAATKKIMDEIFAAKPKALFMLGDVVSLGIRNRSWVKMDKYLKEYRSAGIPVSAVLGNHEVMSRAAKAEVKFQEFFPDHVRTGYYQIVDSVAMILMNSNFNTLTVPDIMKQEKWYKEALEKLDKDSAVKVIIVCCHHSPFTNSKLVKSSKAVQSQFVEPYLKSKKAKLFLSGHAHLFEYFRYKEKDFFVIGGGGGLQHPMIRSAVRLPDLAGGYKPLFHYLTVQRFSDHLNVVSHCLLPDFSGFKEGLTVSIPLKDESNN